MQEYPLLVLAEWDYLEQDFRQELLEYVRQGGNLLLVGPQAAALFEKELGVEWVGDVQPEATLWLEHEGLLGGLSRNPFREARPGQDAKPFGRLFTDNDLTGPSYPAATISEYGQGRLAAVYANLGERYAHGQNYVVRRFLDALTRELFTQPLVEVRGSHTVDVTLGRQGEALLVNLVNTAGPHGDPDVYTYDEIPPLGPLAVTIRMPEAPKHVTLQPAGTDLPFTFRDGKVEVLLPRLEIYDILWVE
jgi:hypothetical protein